MNKSGIVTALVIGVTVVIGGLVWSSGKERKSGGENMQLVGMAMAATVTIDQAIKTALENFPGKIIEAELGKESGKTVWTIEIVTAEQQIMVVQVDAESGSVIATAEKVGRRDKNASASRI
jgi:uncharacterized membrane protein YkoI